MNIIPIKTHQEPYWLSILLSIVDVTNFTWFYLCKLEGQLNKFHIWEMGTFCENIVVYIVYTGSTAQRHSQHLTFFPPDDFLTQLDAL